MPGEQLTTAGTAARSPLPDLTDRAAPAAPEAEELLAGIAAGDESAFAQLYAIAAPRVYGLARVVLRNDGHAQDVVQDVFWQIWRTASRFDPVRGSAWGWILMITHARAVDRVRTIGAQQRRDRSAGLAGFARDHDSVADHIIRGAEHAQVRAGLAHLTDLQRTAVELRYFGAHSLQQISAHLGIPVATVKTRIRDGLIRLRRAVLESG